MKSASISAESAHEIPGRAHGDRVAAIPVPPVGAGETIVLLTWNARPRTGRLHRLNSLEGIVSFSPLDGDEVHEVALAGIKAVHVHGAGIAGSLPAAEADDDRDLLPEERDFQIEFRDGDRLTGRTAGFCADHGGVYLFPIADGIDAVCTFVPHAAAASVHVGPPLGEVLVDEGLLGADDVTAALAAQKARREEPLGVALARQGAVTIMEIEKALEQQRDLPHLKIGQILIEEGLVQQQQLDQALAAQGQNREMPLGKLLVQLGVLSEDKLDRAIARKLGIPSVDLRRFHIDQSALSMVPEDIVFKFRVVPLYSMGTRLVVAVADPLNWQPIEAVSFATGRQVVPVVAGSEEITRVIDLAYSSCTDEEISRAHDNIVNLAAEPDSGSKVSHSDNLVVKLVNKIIVGAYHEGASDIHIEPGRAGEPMNVRIRKEGELHSLLKVPPRLHRAVVARLKVMASLDVTERRRPQDGRIDMRQFGQVDADLRIATVPTVGGFEDVIVRILSSARPVAISNLGLTPSNQDRLLDLLEMPNGLLLVCGPTGSGKTTTLHALLARLNTEDRKIWTAEDPVEITQPGLRQVQVSPETGMTFAAAIRAFLRADPDLIMFGEMRDPETSKVAIEASLTGHLVMSTIHTNSATETIARLLDMGMDPFNFADALGGLLAQRLVKRLCRSCKEPNVASSRKLSELLSEYCAPFASGHDEGMVHKDRELERWARQFSNMEGDFRLYRAVGCDECGGTGYEGRLGLHELFVASEGTKSLIRRMAPVPELRALALEQGMRTLKQDGIEKVLYGLTDMRQVRAVCPD